MKIHKSVCAASSGEKVRDGGDNTGVVTVMQIAIPGYRKEDHAS